jgi:uncharacterized membrane protein
MKIFFWSFSVSVWTVLLGGCFFLAALWFSVQAIRRNPGRKLLAIAELIRLLVVLLLIFTLFRPEIIHRSRKTRQPTIEILCDRSGSMATRDLAGEEDGSSISRENWLSQQCATNFWAPLKARYSVKVEDFDAPPAQASNAPPVDPGTDINTALELAEQKRDNLRAVLLLSDGEWNAGQSPVFAATKLRMRGVPVFTISVGSEKYLPDIEFQGVQAPAYALMDEHVSIPFTIQSRLPHDVKTTVSLVSDSGVQSSKDIVIPAMAQLQDSIMLIPGNAGGSKFTIKIPVERDETFSDNNSKEFAIAFRREKLKVLVVESTPRWEYRFLRNALMRDPTIDARLLLMHPGMDVGSGTGYISSFPATRDELSSYDVVFLGDIGIEPGRFTGEHAEMLKGLVEQQGSGLVFLPGIHGNEKSLLSTPLGDLMPVVLDDTQMNGFGTEMESHIVLTERGRGHLLTMLESDPARNDALWKRLPGFYWYAPVTKAKPGTDVLAVHSVARHEESRIPLLVTRNCGNGKVLFMGTDSAWRWRRGVEDTYHYRFWGQVVRWMAHQRHLAHEEGIRFFFSPEAPSRNEKVFLHATVFDKSGFPIAGGTVRVTISKAGGQTETLDLTPDPGGWGVFTGSFTPHEGGIYNVLIKCDEAERQVKAQLTVSVSRRERVGQPARAGVLREIAAITGGKSGTTVDLNDIVRSIVAMPESEQQEERLKLWCHPLWCGLIILLLAAYWSIRKLMGMV